MTPPLNNVDSVTVRIPSSYIVSGRGRRSNPSPGNPVVDPPLLGDHPYSGGDWIPHARGGPRRGARGRANGREGRRGAGGRGVSWETGKEVSDPWEMAQKFDELEVVEHAGGWSGGRPNSYAPSHHYGPWNAAAGPTPGGRGGWRPWPNPHRGCGGGGGGGRRLEKVEPNPFLETVEAAASSNDGINFDRYEDIPVQVTGDDVPPPASVFSDIALADKLSDNINRCHYVKPTPIQRHAIPILVAGRDLMACAQTGSGKTAAFCFPIISSILKVGCPGGRRPMAGYTRGTAQPVALILSPTRELSCQIHGEAKKFAYQTGLKVVVAYGGAPMLEQLRILEKGVDILVATPGRLVDMVERGKVSLSKIKYLALDEADRMLDMGFEPQVRKIVQQMDMPLPGARQTMLFSATFPEEIQRLASEFLSNYVFLTVGKVGSSTDLISQKVEYVDEMQKRRCLRDLLLASKTNGNYGKAALTLVFVETKKGADSLEQWLIRNGFPATAIHGDKVQMERERALKSFKSGATPILVATDVAARGLDVPSVAHVINYDLPRDISDYVHRIGRTGRAGKSGNATAFFTDKNTPLAKALADLMQEAKQEVPSWLQKYAQQPSSNGYGGGGGGGGSRRYRGGNFGGHDIRNSGYNDCNYHNVAAPSYSPGSSSFVAPVPGNSYGSIAAAGWD